MKNKKAWLIGSLLLVAIALTVVLMTGGGPEIDVVKVTRGTFTLTVEETGYAQPADDFQVQAVQPARVAELLVDVGDKVKAGAVLMRLSSPELVTEIASVRSQLASAEAELETARLSAESLQSELKQAENDRARKKTLLESGALAPADYEQSELLVEKMRKSVAQQEASVNGLNRQVSSIREILNSLETKMGELRVLSPIDGTVLDLPVKAGQVVGSGTVLAQVGADNLEIKTELLSDEIRQIKIGQPTSITAPVLGGQVLKGKVSKIYPQAHEKTSALGVIQRRVPVIISLENTSNLKPGYEVKVTIETLRKEKVILLPRESVRLTNEGKYRIMVVNKNRIEERIIKVGEKNQQWVEVLQGIKPGEIVVQDGSLELKPGSRVQIK